MTNSKSSTSNCSRTGNNIGDKKKFDLLDILIQQMKDYIP